MESCINKDKWDAIASVIVRQEVKVASVLSTTQAMLASLGAKRLCSTLRNANLAL